MRLPLPTPESLNRPRTLLLVVLLTFLTTFMVLIPREELALWAGQRLSQATGLDIRMTHLGWAFPIGLQSSQTHLRLAPGSSPLLSCNRVRLTPAWGRLLRLDPAAAFRCDTADGDLNGTLSSEGALALEIRQLSVQLPLTGGVQGNLRLQGLSGTLRGQRYQTVWRPLMIDLRGDGVQLTSPWIAGGSPVRLTQVGVQGLGDQRTFKLSQLTADGDLTVQGTGQINWRGTTMAGQWNSRLTLTPGEALPPPLQQMLQMVARPQPDGRFLLQTRVPFKLP